MLSDITMQEYSNQLIIMSHITLQEYSNQIILSDVNPQEYSNQIMLISDISVKDYSNQIIFLSDITLQEYSNQIIPIVICYFQKAVEVNVSLLCVSHINSVFIVLLQTEPTNRDNQLRVNFYRRLFIAFHTS
jgi:hypothetical protein